MQVLCQELYSLQSINTSKNSYASHKTSGERKMGKVGMTEPNAQVRRQRHRENP